MKKPFKPASALSSLKAHSPKTSSTQKSPFNATANHRTQSLVIHIAVVLGLSSASYFLVGHVTGRQDLASTESFGKQAALLIDRQVHAWKNEGDLLAQDPSLKLTSTVKAIIPPSNAPTTSSHSKATPAMTDAASVESTLNFVDQDMLNRARKAPLSPEVSMVHGRATVVTISATANGGYVISERPFAPLANDLSRIIPPYIQLTVSQQTGNSPNINVFQSPNNGNAAMNDIPLQTKGWHLSVGKATVFSWNPLENLPLLSALFVLIGGILTLLGWSMIKPSSSSAQTAPKGPTDDEILDDFAQLVSSAPVSISATAAQAPIINPLTPAITATAISKPTLLAETASAPAAEPTTKPSASVQPVALEHDDLLLNDAEIDALLAESRAPALQAAAASTQTPAERSNVIDFKLDDDVLLPDLEFVVAKDELPQRVFRAYDIRGKVSELTATWMNPIGRALGSELKSRGQTEVVVGYDARTTSEEYAKIMREALAESGLQVIDIGRVPTPVMHYAARERAGNGIMITASHNPAEYNGVKWLMQMQSPMPEDIQAIYQRAKNRNFVEGKGKIIQRAFTPDYLDNMLNDIIMAEEYRIVIDGLNGMMGEIAEQATSILGYDVTGINLNPDGHYPKGNPDPTEPNRLTELSERIRQTQSDLGFAFDGDGDRLVVVDKNGTVVTSDQLIALFTMMILEQKPGADIVFDVKCSRMVSQIITSHGGRPIMSRSGNTFIRHAVMSDKHEVAFGGEFSGHYFFNDGRGHATDDGLYAALRLAEWLGQRGEPLQEILQSLPARIGTTDIYLPLDLDLPAQFFPSLAEHAASIPNATLTTIDGVRLDFNDGFGIIRASNTGAFVTLRFEADQMAAVERIRETLHDLIAKQDPMLASKIPRDLAPLMLH